MSGIASAKYWVSTVSREHVLVGKEGGFCQVCHGKKGPLARMKKDDWIIYYSPKMSMGEKESYQKFTAIGKIADDNIYQFKMFEGFIPFRRDVVYAKDAKEVDIRPLLGRLSFTQGSANWGAKFRFGIFEISKQDFDIISQSMMGPREDKQKAASSKEKDLPRADGPAKRACYQKA